MNQSLGKIEDLRLAAFAALIFHEQGRSLFEVSKPGSWHSGSRMKISPTDLSGWRVVNNAYAQNKHTIPIYSFEPPTALKHGGVFIVKNTGGKTMRPLICAVSTALVSILAADGAFGLGIGDTDCAKDRRTTIPITHGWRTTIKYAYSSPNCIYTCPCAIVPYSYSCDCDSGYYPINQGSSSCTCDGVCPTNSTCTSTSSFSCNRGFYKNGSSCTACPGGGTTPRSGATSVTSCYLAAGAPGSDSGGTYTFTSNCYYTN